MRESCVALRYKDGKPFQAVILTLDFHKEDTLWVASCLELGTATDDSDIEVARKELLENISLQLDGAEELGFIAEYLKERNIHVFSLPREQTRTNVATWAVTA